jgi:hypothetical protein
MQQPLLPSLQLQTSLMLSMLSMLPTPPLRPPQRLLNMMLDLQSTLPSLLPRQQLTLEIQLLVLPYLRVLALVLVPVMVVVAMATLLLLPNVAEK